MAPPTRGATVSAADPIHAVVERWHAVLRGGMAGLEDILHEDCTFLSPIVFTPQRGRDVTMLYLRAAGSTLAVPPSSDGEEVGGDGGDAAPRPENPFRYVKQVLDGHHAVLEFETEVDGISVNGVDIITCDDDGLIVEFKVMIRPLQAVNKVHAQMKEMLERMQAAG
jgi:hypothetical protein